jgi:hypothetical protein
VITLVDLYDKLKLQDEITLLELLEITSEELVERFTDIIEEKYEELAEDFEPEDDYEE